MITINHVPIFKVTKSKRISNSKKFQFKKNSIHNMLKMNSLVEAEQIFSIENGPSITLKHISVDANLIIDEQYHQQIRRILKKSLPPNIQIQLLYASNNVSVTHTPGFTLKFLFVFVKRFLFHKHENLEKEKRISIEKFSNH